VFASITDRGDCGTEAAWNRLRRPGPEGDFPHPLKAEDLQVRIPEPAFLLRKAVRDGVEAGLAGRQDAVIPRANQIDALFPTNRRQRRM